MIIYVSHIGITYNSSNLLNDLKKTDFKIFFYEKNLKNSNKKIKFLKYYSNKHSILFYKNKNWNFGLELIQYKKINSTQEFNKLNNLKLKKIKFSKINKLKNLTLYSANILKDYNLFKSMNFLLNPTFNKNSFLGELPSFKSLKKEKVDLIIKKKKTKKKIYLDDKGFNFISFFSTNLNNDIKILKKKGIKLISKTINIKINNNKFRLILFRTFGGIILELIERYEKKN